MKNFLTKTVYLFAFVIAGIIFQISCSNSDDQSLPASQLGKLIYSKWDGSGQTIWICDYDGSNQTQIPVALPSNLHFNTANGNVNAKLSPDGQTIFFVVIDDTSGLSGANVIYSCDISGNNLQAIVTPAVGAGLSIGNAI